MDEALRDALRRACETLGPGARFSLARRGSLVEVRIVLGRACHGGTPQWGAAAHDPAFVLRRIDDGVEQLRRDRERLAHRRDISVPLHGPAVLSPSAAGVFVHECFGHTSEADNYLARSPSLRRALGDRWTAAPLTVRDRPSAWPYAGSYERDDEGTVPRTVTLLTAGRWTGLLTHTPTSALSGGVSTGHGRGAAGRPALPRCSVLDVLPGDFPPSELLRRMGDGWLLGTPIGGFSVRRLLVLELLWVQRVYRGRLVNDVRGPAVICADKAALAAQVAAVGDDVTVNSSPYTCVKEGYEVGSTLISPSLLLGRCVLRPLAHFPGPAGGPAARGGAFTVP
ncbi:metallopeptidase TldD-related protein [Streptomyces sp. NPDC088554]|uniref:metallopeptidase TldD-related protein n=1 Tax=Streptomyces sp. NPDC088554 TaxID=3365865 RepID=UPI00382A37B6